MKLFFSKESIILRYYYPLDLLKKWNLVTNSLISIVSTDESIITFGSFVIGDFLWLKIKDTKLYASDFEFTILTNERNKNILESKSNKISEEFNNSFTKDHWSFNCNVATETWSSFLSRLKIDSYLRNEIIKTCSIISKNDIINTEFKQMKLKKIEPKQLGKILKNICLNLLITLDDRFIHGKELFDIYTGSILSKSILKIYKLYLQYIGRDVVRYNDMLRNSGFDLLIASMYNQLFVEKNAIKIHKKYIDSFEDIIKRITSLQDEFSVIHELTIRYLQGLEKGYVSENLNSFRVDLVKSYLKNKGDHYAFYKNKYL